MKLFELHREDDTLSNSRREKDLVKTGGRLGTAVVAQGVLFDNGKLAMTWLTKHASVAIYDDVATLEAVHGHSGETWCVWLP